MPSTESAISFWTFRTSRPFGTWDMLPLRYSEERHAIGEETTKETLPAHGIPFYFSLKTTAAGSPASDNMLTRTFRKRRDF